MPANEARKESFAGNSGEKRPIRAVIREGYIGITEDYRSVDPIPGPNLEDPLIREKRRVSEAARVQFHTLLQGKTVLYKGIVPAISSNEVSVIIGEGGEQKEMYNCLYRKDKER